MQKYAACASVYKTITLNKKGEIKCITSEQQLLPVMR
jgi:hypothetical protein